jgi:hypothetical protein
MSGNEVFRSGKDGFPSATIYQDVCCIYIVLNSGKNSAAGRWLSVTWHRSYPAGSCGVIQLWVLLKEVQHLLPEFRLQLIALVGWVQATLHGLPCLVANPAHRFHLYAIRRM